MDNTKTTTSINSESIRLTPIKFYACLAIYLFAFLFKAQILALFWGVFFFTMFSDLLARLSQSKGSLTPLLFRLLLCGLFTYGFAAPQAWAVTGAHLMAALYISLLPRPSIIEETHFRRFRLITLSAVALMTVTLYTHGLIIHN